MFEPGTVTVDKMTPLAAKIVSARSISAKFFKAFQPLLPVAASPKSGTNLKILKIKRMSFVKKKSGINELSALKEEITPCYQTIDIGATLFVFLHFNPLALLSVYPHEFPRVNKAGAWMIDAVPL
jgi:hypothetical protein